MASEKAVEAATIDIPTNYDASYLRDLTDIVKNKTLFFIPFFGVYLAFLFAKTDYIKQANVVIWIILAAIFAVSIRYIHLVSQFLWAAESTRLAFKLRDMGHPVITTEDEKKAIRDIMTLIPKMVAAEDWWFKRIMFLMYMGTFCVLSDVFVGKYVSAHVLELANALFK